MAKARKQGRSFLLIAHRFVTSLSDLLRALGMQSLNFIIYDQRKPERPKYVIRKSFWINMSRCAVHLFPAAFCVFLAYLNRLEVFIGPGFSVRGRSDGGYFIAYQIAAKILELLSIASMGTVLLQAIRHNLLYEDGVPLGLLSSHLWISKPQSVLSPEYLSAAQAIVRDCFRLGKQMLGGRWSGHEVIVWLLRRIYLFALITFAILVAALIGPFSAVLLIPRDQYFDAGGTQYNLNATKAELWPAVITADLELAACFSDEATQYPVCPSGGYPSARNHWALSNIYDADGFRPSVDGSSDGWASYASRDPWGILPIMIGLGNDRNGAIGGYMPTLFTQPNAYTAVMIQTLLRDWYSAAREASEKEETHSGPLQSARSFIHAPTLATTISRYPITSVRCSLPQNLSASAETFQFHRFRPDGAMIDMTAWSVDNDTTSVNISNLQRHPLSHVRTQWVDLPPDLFGPVSTGLLFEMPWTASRTSRVAVGCTAVAAWCTSELQFLLEGFENAVISDWSFCSGRPTKNLSDDMDLDWTSYNRHIALDHKWLDLLAPKAPTVPDSNGTWQPSTLDMVFEAAGYDMMMQELRSYPHYIGINDTCGIGQLDPTMTDLELWNARVCNQQDKVVFIERTVARLITDGLSRRLSCRAFDTLPNRRAWIVNGLPRNEDYNKKLLDIQRRENAIEMSADESRVVQEVKVYVYGLGYAASTKTDSIAIGVVCAYVAVSLLHVLLSSLTRISSISWESPLELMLLALNSPENTLLKATSAQIHRWKTYQIIAKVFAKAVIGNDTNAAPEMHLQLIVENPPHIGGSGPSSHTASNSLGRRVSLSSPSQLVIPNEKYY